MEKWNAAEYGGAVWDENGKRIATVYSNQRDTRMIAAAPAMAEALKLAQAALNTAARFKVPGLPAEHNDSYKIAAIIDAALAKGGV